VLAWTWSRSVNNDCANVQTGPRVSGHTCVPANIIPSSSQSQSQSQSNNKHDKIFLFGGELPIESVAGAGASNSNLNTATTKTTPQNNNNNKPKLSGPSSIAKARAESAAAVAAATAGGRRATTTATQQPPASEDEEESPPHSAATNDLWVYEKDKSNGKDDWEKIPKLKQGISRPSPRTHAATAVLGDLMYLFGGWDPEKKVHLTDVWYLSLKTNRWSLDQAWMPYGVSHHTAVAVSDTTIALYTHKGVLLYDMGGPVSTVVVQPTTGQGPIGLRNCACCAIPRNRAGTGTNMLLFGGSTGTKQGFSSAAFELDTKSWSWKKLLPTSLEERPRSLQSACVASLGNNQCVVFGGATLQNDRVIPSDETWLLTVQNGEAAHWEQIAVPVGGTGGVRDVTNGHNQHTPPLIPEARLAAALTATTSEELVLQGGYDPRSQKTYGGPAGGTWILTKHPIDPTIAIQRTEARQTLKDAQLSESETAAARVSDIIAEAGSGMGFDGSTLGVGGLDDVLGEIKTRIWTPLAAPPQLLQELGIKPTRGLLLYGLPGCGKTLLASTLGSMLSPFRPITVVNGPEILDKFVGSSEQNLRDIFDNPPDIYETFKSNEPDGGTAMNRAAVHVIVMDEFDAVARARGGNGGQGDAGVARDSVVNQLLAKMDGVQPLSVPTLVIGLTNKRSLIEPALLRPGRFEVQIEITPPKTAAQRRSILMVHTKQMFDAGRLQVHNPPPGSPAAHQLKNKNDDAKLLTYDQLTTKLANECDGFSGASIAGVVRAAASRALARAVGQRSDDFDPSSVSSNTKKEEDTTTQTHSTIMDCLVTQEDLYQAIQDAQKRSGFGDHTTEEEGSTTEEDIDSKRRGFRTPLRLRHRLRSWILAK